MKRNLLIVFTLSVTLSVFSQSKDFSRWSFAPEFGINKLDGDVDQNLTIKFPTSFRNLTYGGTLEYAFTPIWGLALDYYYFPLTATNSSVPVDIFTQLYNSDLTATINFTRWIFPKSRSKFYVTGSAGLGLAYYTFNVTPVSQSFATNYSIAGSVPVSFSLEYNFSKPLAFGLKVNYRAYTKDNLEGSPKLNYKGVTNDYVAAGTLFLRYKFSSVKKKHMRNISMDAYEPDAGLVYAKVLKSDFNELKEELDSFKRKVYFLEANLYNLNNRISVEDKNVAQNELLNNRDSDISLNTDPIPILKRQPSKKTPDTNSTVRLKVRHHTLYRTSGFVEGSEIGYDSKNFGSIYFDTNQFLLNKIAIEKLRVIAKKMIEFPQLMLQIYSYCDDTGDDLYNNELSRIRADHVKESLVQKWGIAPDRIISIGRGKASTPKPNEPYRPGRRCDFYFST